jgi:hypothetical protein
MEVVAPEEIPVSFEGMLPARNACAIAFSKLAVDYSEITS